MPTSPLRNILAAIGLTLTLGLLGTTSPITVASAWAQTSDGAAPMVPVPAATLSGPVQTMATDMETRFSQLEMLVRSLTNQAEQNQFQLTRLQQQVQQLAEQVQRLTPPMVGADGVARAPAGAAAASPPPAKTGPAPSHPAAAVPAATTPAPIAASAEADADEAGSGAPTQSGAPDGKLGTLKYAPGSNEAISASPPVKGVSAGPIPLGAKEQFDKGMTLLRQSNYDEAGAAFEQFLRDNPKHALADQARNWLAEIQYVQGHFDQSAVAFADAYQKAPKGPKAANNLLKLGLSLAALGKNKDACDTLSALTAQTPGSDPALRARAREEAKRLKCGKPAAH